MNEEAMDRVGPQGHWKKKLLVGQDLLILRLDDHNRTHLGRIPLDERSP